MALGTPRTARNAGIGRSARRERFTAAALACAAAVSHLLLAPCARAQSAYEARARVPSPRIARRTEDATVATTGIDLTGRPAPVEDVADVLSEVPGARVLESGGYGAFASVSLRGNEPSHTTWLLGEAPLSDPEGGSFDASLLPLAQLERIDVYRGGAPVWLSHGAIGGAVRLLPREDAGSGVEARLGKGSYGFTQGSFMGHGRPARSRLRSWFASAQVTRSDGDFPYLDDRATRFDASDDLELRLRNAEVTDGAGLAHLRAWLAGGELDFVAFGVRRLGGVPGAAGLGSNALQTHRALLFSVASAAYTRRGELSNGRGYRLQAVASGRYSATELYDPVGELGGGRPDATRDAQLHGFGRLAASAELTRFLEATALATYAGADGQRESVLGRAPLGGFGRVTAAGAFELRLFGAPFALPSELRASARAELTHVSAELFERGRARRYAQDRVGQAYRVAIASRPWPALQLRASAGTGSRMPTAKELFGDGVALRPNAELVPEHGRYADVGAVVAHAGEDASATLELSAFAQDVEDKIVYVSTNQFESRARNLGRTQVRGFESGFDLALAGGPRLVASATLLQTRTRMRRQLPLRPKLRANGRLEQSLHPRLAWAERVTAFVSLEHESSAFYDQANEVLRGPLTKLGCGLLVALLDERLELAARVADVFDARGQDYLRFPLPGRSFFFLATFREATP